MVPARALAIPAMERIARRKRGHQRMSIRRLKSLRILTILQILLAMFRNSVLRFI